MPCHAGHARTKSAEVIMLLLMNSSLPTSLLGIVRGGKGISRRDWALDLSSGPGYLGRATSCRAHVLLGTVKGRGAVCLTCSIAS